MFETIWKKILRRGKFSFLLIPAFILWLFSFIYRLGFMLSRKFASQPTKVSKPVISVGNITVGGSGKTPLVSFLARDLIEDGLNVGIVSSGYSRISTENFIAPGYTVQQMDVKKTSDEVMLLSHLLPQAQFSVHQSKTEAASALVEMADIDVILVDDGFQHFSLARDIDIVAYDAGVPRRMLKPFPNGILRESFKSLKRADIIIITRARFAVDLGEIKERLNRINQSAELYHANFLVENIVGRDQTLSAKYLEDKSIFLFAGVGNFRSLTKQVTALVGDLDDTMEFSDHQHYGTEELENIKEQADRNNSDLILTTFKDWVKLNDFDFGREIYYLDLEVDLDPGEEKLLAYICDKLKLNRNKN